MKGGVSSNLLGCPHPQLLVLQWRFHSARCARPQLAVPLLRCCHSMNDA